MCVVRYQATKPPNPLQYVTRPGVGHVLCLVLFCIYHMFVIIISMTKLVSGGIGNKC